MTIAQVSQAYDLTPDTLRYYEKIGLLPPIHRTSGGIREYTEEDCKWVQFIHCMRSVGLSIEALTEYVTLFKEGDKTHEARKQILVEQRNMLAKRIEHEQAVLNRLEHKIARYEQEALVQEATLSR